VSDLPNPTRLSLGDVLRWAGGLGAVAIAVLRVMTAFAPDPHFGADPMLFPVPPSGLGPAGSLLLDALLLFACGLALFGEALARRGVDWRIAILAILPIPVVVWHGWSDFDDLWRSSTWIAGAFSAVTIAHLARDRAMRIAIIALLAAVIAPLVVRGLAQVFIEHPEMVEDYRRNTERILAAQGLEPGSTQAMLYERRLMQPEATGWFGLSNVFGSFMVYGLVAWLGATFFAVRTKAPSGWTGVLALGAVAAAAGLWLSFSNGAVAAALLGLAILILPLAWRAGRDLLDRRGGRLAFAGIILALLAVTFRGAVLPEDFLGDRSVLFRWHYLVAAGRIIADAPLLGVGPGGFQAAYVLHRLPIAPEEVQSAHSLFVDWLAMLGVCGVGLALLVLHFLWHGLRWRNGEHETNPSNLDGSRCVAIVLGATLLGAVPSLYIEQAVLDPFTMMLRILGVLGYLGTATILLRVLARGGSSPLVRWTIAAAATAFIVHCQIEVTMLQPSAAVWGFAVLGAVAPVDRTQWQASGSRVLGAGLVVLSIAHVVLFAAPAVVQQRQIDRAAAPLREIGRAMAEGREISRAEEAARRRTAAGMLAEAYDMMPSNTRPLRAAVDQGVTAALLTEREAGEALLREALARAEAAIDDHPGPAAASVVARTAAALHDATGDPAALERAIQARRTLTTLDPHGLRAWVDLGDLLWQAGRRDAARDAYRRALEISDQRSLDPLRQLSASESRRLRARIEPEA